jgi:hypothetical protein
MQLDELTQDRSINTISKKTNLTVSVVEKLFNKDFDSFSYPQAMGAIAIIEREFDMNLDILREECKYYFAQNIQKDEGISVIKPIKEDKPLIPKLITIFLLAVIVYGAWYFFVEYYNKQIIPSKPISSISIQDTILQKDDTQIKEVESKKVIVTDNSTKVAEPKSMVETPTVVIEDKKIVVIEDTNVTQKSDLEINSTLISAPSIVETNQSVEKNSSSRSALELIVPTKREQITLIPAENMWFRLIDLDTKKRREYKRKSPYNIDVSQNSWIFAAQNVDFSFKDMNKSSVYGGRGKLFYRLDQDGVHKLSEKEFRELEK